MRILVIDNYDSFVYNLVYLLRQEPTIESIDVVRNDKIDMEKVAQYDKILLSPGPGLPEEAGLMPQLIQTYFGQKSMLGVCLGHQAIAEHLGAKLKQLAEVKHGRAGLATIDTESKLFRGLAKQLKTAHYHSWIVEAPPSSQLPIRVTAMDEEGRIMAFQHTDLPLYGLQFHPESVLCDQGAQIIKNWIDESE